MYLLKRLLTGFFLLTLCTSAGWASERNFAAKSSSVSSEKSSSAARVWLSYYKEEANPSYNAISGFIEKHPDFPAMNRLREQAEKAMPSDISDPEAFAWFSKNPPQTAFGMKVYARALMKAGHAEQAKEEIRKWWKTSSLKPDDQKEGYAAFQSYLDREVHEERLRRLIHKEQYTNARALARTLGEGYVALAEARIALKTDNGNANAYLNRIPSSLQNDEGLLFDRLHWRRMSDNNVGAIEILNRSPSSDKMYDPEAWGKERSILVYRLIQDGKYDQAYHLSANHRIKDGPAFAINEWTAGWIAMEHLNKPWKAFEHFERMYHTVETPISKSRAAYWAGLASEKLKHPEVARKWYDVGATYQTTFYGQLSANKTGQPDTIRNIPVSSSAAVKNNDLAQAARWLRQNGYKSEASMFLNKMIETAKTPEDFAAVADVAVDLSMKNFAIKAAQECEKEHGISMVSYAFPKIEKYMNDEDVEWALIHALVRQESRYDSEAVSSAGARGLMQLMPRTADEIAQKAGLSHQTKWLTSKPSHNVALGTRYLERLLNLYDGNYAMALAAYNAGPGRVREWIAKNGDPRNPKVDLVNWIEMIPIYETRNYVQRVLEGVHVYRQTLSANKGKPHEGILFAAQ